MQTKGDNWKALVIGSDPVVNGSISLLLEDLCFQDKSFTIFESTSIDRAKDTLAKELDITIIFIDFLEFQNEKLDFIKYIKQDPQNKKIRIILGLKCSEEFLSTDIIEQYEVDGWFCRAPLSESYFKMVIITVLRSYNQIVVTEKMLQSLANSVSHELKNTLSSVKLASQVIQGIIDNAQLIKKGRERGFLIPLEEYDVCRDLVGNIYKSSIQGNSAIDIVFMNVKYDINQKKFERLFISEIVRQAVETYPYCNEKEKLATKLHINQDFPFYGDRMLTVYVLLNLMKNSFYYLRARKYGELQISSILGEEYNMLKIIDNGPGIEPERMPCLFESFMSHSREEDIGFGLPFCKKIMKSMGGDISCISKLDDGAAFTLTFPVLKQGL